MASLSFVQENARVLSAVPVVFLIKPVMIDPTILPSFVFVEGF